MPRLLADALIQQATVQPATDRIALTVKGSAAGLTTDLTEWQTSGGTILARVDQNGNFRSANAKGLYLDMASGNQGYMIGTAANQVDIRGGSAGLRVLNNAGSVTNLTLADSGAATFNSTLQVPDPTSVRIPTPTNFVTTVPSGSTSPYFIYNPISKYAWHDLLAFNRWWGAPTFETFTSSWAADTLNNSLWASLENTAITVIDGATKTAARWTWNSGNVAFCYVEWWLLGFTYAGATNSIKNFLVETSPDGTAWTTIHTSTGNTANAAPVLLYAPLNTSNTWVRLTITVTNAITLPMSTIRALSTRWGNQGGGSENTFPYSWDTTQRMAIGPAAVVANANLTVGTNTTAASGGMYFGTDTNLYRLASNSLQTDGAFTAGGVTTIGGTVGGGVLSLKPGASADHAYMQFYARTATPTTRSGYLGFPSAASTTLAMTNEISGGIINLTTTAGSVQANGSIILARSDFATNTVALGTAAAAGAANSVMRSDATIAAFDATVPVTQAFGDAAATGAVNFAARRDHRHGMPTLGAASKSYITRIDSRAILR